METDFGLLDHERATGWGAEEESDDRQELSRAESTPRLIELRAQVRIKVLETDLARLCQAGSCVPHAEPLGPLLHQRLDSAVSIVAGDYGKALNRVLAVQANTEISGVRVNGLLRGKPVSAAFCAEVEDASCKR